MNCKFCKADCCSRGLNRDAAFCAGWIKMTNADRIRSMTDEELAVFMCKIVDDCTICVGRDTCTYGRKGTIDWLEQEAET